MSIITNFINGLRKSFDGKDHLREINQCEKCGRPAFTNVCGYCRTESHYKISEKQERRNKRID